MGDKKKDDDDGEDPRYEFLLNYCIKSHKIRQEKWNKLMATEEYKIVIKDFFDKPHVMTMFIYLSMGGVLVAQRSFSKEMRTKFTYFFKKCQTTIAKDVVLQSFRELILFGDMANRPIEELEVLMDQVFFSILSNPMNQRGWPKVVAEDILSHIKAFRNIIVTIKGAMLSQTILPMPPNIQNLYPAINRFRDSDGVDVDVVLKSAIEGVVAKWWLVVDEVLRQKSDIAFEDGANPTPMREIEFWDARLRNLEGIYDQLRDPRIKKIGEYLEMTQSAYSNTFKRLFKNVVAGVMEARDICLYLKATKRQFAHFEEEELFETKCYIKPLVHCVALLWANSKYYAKHERMVILFKETGNLFIEASERVLDPGSIFQGDAEDVHMKIEKVLDILNHFLETFDYVQGQLPTYFKREGKMPALWTFHIRNVFQRLMDFIERLKLIDSVLLIAIEFTKLEKVEFSGTKGRTLSARNEGLMFDFQASYAIFPNITYDVCDVSNHNLEKDTAIFMQKVEDMDQRLAALFAAMFDELGTPEALCRFVGIMGSLVDRPVIFDEITPRYIKIIDLFNKELDETKQIYDEGLKKPCINKMFPPVAGKMYWLYKMKQRVSTIYEFIKSVEHKIMHQEEAERSYEKFHHMVSLIDAEWKNIFNQWTIVASSDIERCLAKYELIRNSDRLVEINFDPALESVIFEVRYMKLLDVQDIPADALDLYNKYDMYYFSILKYLRICEYYNYMKTKTIPVEYDLIDFQLGKIDLLLYRATEELIWAKHDEGYVLKLIKRVKKLYDRVIKAQENLAQIMESLIAWSHLPIYCRKDCHKDELLYLDDRPHRLENKYRSIATSAMNARELLKENYKLLVVLYDDEEYGEEEEEEEEEERGVKIGTEDLGEEADEAMARHQLWLNYLAYADELISREVIMSVLINYTYFLREMGDRKPVTPLFQIKMELHDSEIVYVPSLRRSDEKGWYNLLKSIIEDCKNSAKYMYRVDSPWVRITNEEDEERDLVTDQGVQVGDETNLEEGPEEPDVLDLVTIEENYYEDMLHDDDCEKVEQCVLDRVENAISKAFEYQRKFDSYAYLWLDDRQKYLKEFLTYGHVRTAEEIEILEQEGTLYDERKPCEPTLAQFRNIINHFYEVYYQAEKIEDKAFIAGGWLVLIVKPLKQAILNLVCKWGLLFKRYLYDFVINSLNELEQFIAQCLAAFSVELKEDDYDSLVLVMSYLQKLKDRTATTDNMFQPLREIIDLLREYGMEFEETTYVKLIEIPDRWNTCKKQANMMKNIVTPLQTLQVKKINKRLATFELRVDMFCNAFKHSEIFEISCAKPYDILDELNHDIEHFEAELAVFNGQGSLFEIPIPEFDKLSKARKDVKALKQLWDFANILISCMDEWKRTSWKKIDVDNMEMECKRYAKDMRSMDKDIRNIDLYLQCEGLIKNLLTSLRAIVELQNPAIKDRHWVELMQATKVKFNLDDSTTLQDLLVLNLHVYEEEVKTIADKAVKEMAMEKVLREMDATWAIMEYSAEPHERTGLKLLIVREEVIEALEEAQVALQTMLTSKFIGFFFDIVNDWQRKLSNADQVTRLFTEVQRKWAYLESIFIGSEDIRTQLPEDSKRFEMIDRSFKEILRDMTSNLKVLVATSKPGLSDRLEQLLVDLGMCEKALNDYLDTKRLAFPRFYFVSAADLLDILSTGNQPELVQKHLTKLFDSMASLTFVKEGGRNTKKANGMVAKELDEHVPFIAICDCSGKVEIWLNRLIDAMVASLHYIFRISLKAYPDKPRDQWVFDYPAQPALCGTQIWWTTETNEALFKLEEGHEGALKDYQRKQIIQLNALILLLLLDLSKGDRQKLNTICTIDVHSRDVVFKMIQTKVENSQAFQWQSQLRHRWDWKIDDCFANICDAQFRYQYEYLGNTPRLVVTPLTDRCYITLSQSLHLIMGGAPAGPAGTGKTETTKDLGKALGLMVYVFNCSEQMDYKSLGNIYKGLAQAGCWGCFDEFNRISVEVLSVVAVQVKSIQDAIRDKKTMFNFLGEFVKLIPTVGIFITMNPGYAGRTELPENLKALFRPCAMCVPDFALISEIMLVAEGFQEAKLLARKFITLYTLCKELLSKQDHYDWGLRAIKSVLVVAGNLRRGDPQRPEDQVLMRALRDFNIPKIVTDDVAVFMGLIGDLFPALDVPRKRDPEFEKTIRASAVDLKLQPEDSFVLKVVQLEELFAVRHSVFIIGNAGTGKSQVWKTLNKTYANQKRKPFYNDLNPKAVTNDELFGVINPATREWKDGLFSVIMRDQANMPGDGPKWIVLDGDIDPMWIESLNTLMDDNKILTLASNERIALTKAMRLLFEIYNLRTATPATVSRAGILYINPSDLGWSPYITSWLDTRSSATEQATLSILFDKYIPPILENLRLKFKKITPIPDIGHLVMICHLLECFLIPANVPSECPKEWYEIYFVFCVIWAFGSALFQDQMCDWRFEFSKWFVSEFKSVKFPVGSTVFNFYIDPETKKFLPWSNLVKDFELDTEIPMQATLVNTSETTRVRFFLDILIAKKVPVMLIGPTGSGKSVLIADKLQSLPDSYAIANVPFNFYTSSELLQRILEKPLEKKAGRVYGPPGSKQLIYFIDDMNMPEVDKYFTAQAHTIIRQWMDYQHWYDRQKLSLKDIHNVQFISSMNPTAGSFTINPRLQRHFCVFAVSFPSMESSRHIYYSILHQHLDLDANRFPPNCRRYANQIINAAITLHAKVSASFLPTAIKFHYLFTLRDLSNIFQGMLFTNGDSIKSVMDLVRLYLHEAQRVYGDKLVEQNDILIFKKLVSETQKKCFEDLDENEMNAPPLIFCHFAEGIGDPKYFPVRDMNVLSKLLNEALEGYNDLVGSMNLVLFEDAMLHICRINRIMESPRGNGLLVGVGGSGKQSLTRLSAFISSFEVFQIQLKKGYSINDMKADFAGLYIKAGLKSVGVVFLMSDSQVPEESFLVLINDVLASGEISDLLADDEVENVINTVRGEVKGAGLVDTREVCWKFFIDRVRRLLKIVLCFSPVGSTLRVRGRKFPAVVNCTAINWFHEWPREALISVSKRFLGEISALPVHLTDSVAFYMSYVHNVVNEMSEAYLRNERRYNYTTPKSFLECIALYSKLLTEKTKNLKTQIQRLEVGLTKLASTSEEVDGLKDVLAVQEVELKAKNEDANRIIAILTVENEKVAKEQAIASEEEAKVRVIEEDVTAKAALCAEDLAKAQPALDAAEAALATLNKNNLTELKSFGTPPPAVANVASAVLVLFSKPGKIPKDRSWQACKVIMGKVDEFLNNLLYYEKEKMSADVVKATMEYLKDPEFDPEKVKTKSLAAAGLCAWVINILKFYEVFLVVQPKKLALEKADRDLSDARNKLAALTEKLRMLEEQLGALKKDFDDAIDKKMKCQAEADATALSIDLANRLVGGLASENVRWKEKVKMFKQQVILLPGDVLIVTSFISYVGCFTRRYRVEMMDKYWLPYLLDLEVKIPRTEGANLLQLMVDDAQIAQWNNEGLPSDSMSTENACILTNSARWPLMIDPQLQGIKWIKTKYGHHLVIVRLTARNYMDTIERCVSNGNVIMLENIGETMDAVLDPVLGRVLIKKGKCIKIGDREVDYNPNFKMIIHTKLANPHYKPEIQAQTTLINFTVTRDGLEEQLLGEVVKIERPDLEEQRVNLTKEDNNNKITLKRCEDSLLYRLSSATGNILGDVELVENLETTKKTATEIESKVEISKLTAIRLNEARETYRPCATRASIIYFILSDLFKINALYQFSLKAFTVVFKDALVKAEEAEDFRQRLINLVDNVTFMTYMYTCRGLFERDKMIFMAQMVFQVLLHAGELDANILDFLLRFPIMGGLISPFEFLSDNAWGACMALSNLDEFKGFDKDIEVSEKRWKKFIDCECPEKEKFPGEWKTKNALERLCMMRCVRPDRMIYAVRDFIEEKMGSKYVTARTVPFAKSYEETSNSTPTFFILSPGVNPLLDVERLGRKLGFTRDGGNFHQVSLGQGQEVVAEYCMDISATGGHWVVLENIHLVAKWLGTLEKKMEYTSEHSVPSYRLYLSAEASGDPTVTVIPQGILESSIKITNEPPTGMFANLHKALDNFTQETLEMCSKEAEFKAFLFALCYFHAVVAERRKFGPQGWNRNYPFNNGDLTISVNVLYNYLENNAKVPYEDLRYLFGEIMYGGHITDDWDRRLCRTYLLTYMQPELVEGELEYAPGFLAPPNTDFVGYHKWIDDKLPPESPYLYGLHPNAEIGFLAATTETMFQTIFEMQPRDAGGGGGGGYSREEKVKMAIEDIMDRLPDLFNVPEMMAKVEDKTPYIIVAFQECDRMNTLTGEMKRSLKELELGLKGELTITSDMETLEAALFMDQVPISWSSKAYASMLPLGQWTIDLNLRINELEKWVADFTMPPTVWLAGFFNPQSFLTAIMQQTARKNEWPLDKMCLQTDVTKKQKNEFQTAPREGANVHGLFMEGARWDIAAGTIADSKLRELWPVVPVIYIKAITQDKQDLRSMYDCPVYKIRQRGPNFVWTFNLKSKERPTKWTLAGVCILLQI